MTITFWVTENCNLRCSYCYVKKNAKSMEMKTAKAALLFAYDKIDNSNNSEIIHVKFHGGEPLLNFNIIKYLWKNFKKKYGHRIIFGLTTNGTIFNKEIFNILIDNFQLSVSLDGTKISNDINRVDKNGKGTFINVQKTLNYLLDKKYSSRIRMTVNLKNCSELYNNFNFIYNYGFKIIDFEIDMMEKWKIEDLNIYYKNYIKIIEYLIQKDFELAQFYLYNLKEISFKKVKRCNGGISSFQISPMGLIYPCVMSVDDMDCVIGNVFDGIDQTNLNELLVIYEKPNKVCGDCAFILNCPNTICKLINKHFTGSYYNPLPVSCYIQDIEYKICKRFEYILAEK